MDYKSHSKQKESQFLPGIFNNNSESYPLEEITHYSRIPNNDNNYNGPMVHHTFNKPTNTSTSSEDYSSEPLSLGNENPNNRNNETASKASAGTSSNTKSQYSTSKPDLVNTVNTFPSPISSSSSDDEEITQYNRHERKFKGGSQNQTRPNEITAGNSRRTISDDNFPTILNSNAVVNKSDLTFSILTLFITGINFLSDLILVFWHYNNEHAWYSACTAIIMTFGACSMLHQFSLVDIERLKRIFDHARRARILTNCFPICGTFISSTFLVSTALKASTNQMYALQYFSLEEFLQNLLRVQSLFQAAPQAILQLLILLETLDELSTIKGIFLLLNIIVSLTIMTIGNIPSRSEEFDSAISPGVYSPITRIFIGVRMFSCFASRIMSIVYILLGLNCLLGKFSSFSTFESFLISFSIILIPRLAFTFVDYFHRRFRRSPKSNNNSNNSSLSCCRIFIGYLATIFFPMSDPLWIFWYIWFETIIFLLFGNIVGWNDSTNCIHNLVNSIYTAIFIIVFLVIPIFLPFARAKVKKRQLKKLENIFERGVNNCISNTNDNNSSNVGDASTVDSYI